MSKKIEIQEELIEKIIETAESANIRANTKAEEISKRLGKKIETLIFKNTIDEDGDWIVGYLKEPQRREKLHAFDLYKSNSETAAGEFLLEACLLKDESDYRLTSQDSKYDSLYLGAITSVSKMVTMNIDVSKKNENSTK